MGCPEADGSFRIALHRHLRPRFPFHQIDHGQLSLLQGKGHGDQGAAFRSFRKGIRAACREIDFHIDLGFARRRHLDGQLHLLLKCANGKRRLRIESDRRLARMHFHRFISRCKDVRRQGRARSLQHNGLCVGAFGHLHLALLLIAVLPDGILVPFADLKFRLVRQRALVAHHRLMIEHPAADIGNGGRQIHCHLFRGAETEDAFVDPGHAVFKDDFL